MGCGGLGPRFMDGLAIKGNGLGFGLGSNIRGSVLICRNFKHKDQSCNLVIFKDQFCQSSKSIPRVTFAILQYSKDHKRNFSLLKFPGTDFVKFQTAGTKSVIFPKFLPKDQFR